MSSIASWIQLIALRLYSALADADKWVLMPKLDLVGAGGADVPTHLFDGDATASPGGALARWCISQMVH